MIALIVSTLFAIGSDAFVLFPTSSPQASAVPHCRLTQLHDSIGAQDHAAEVVVEKTKSKKYVIVGGGWGGWGAAKALCERWVIVMVY